MNTIQDFMCRYGHLLTALVKVYEEESVYVFCAYSEVGEVVVYTFDYPSCNHYLPRLDQLQPYRIVTYKDNKHTVYQNERIDECT